MVLGINAVYRQQQTAKLRDEGYNSPEDIIKEEWMVNNKEGKFKFLKFKCVERDWSQSFRLMAK